MLKTRTTALLAALVAVSLSVAGCAATPSAETVTEAPTASAADSLTITDAWVKSADEGMSAAFGVLENSSGEDIVVESAESAASSMLELHETVENDSGEMVMQQKEGGFVIPAGSSFVLEPGGNHIMLMDVTAPLVAGAEVTFTLTLSDGSTFHFTAPVKDYSGATEEYVGGDMDMDMGN